MKITLYGGINEIGGNKILLESQDGTRIFLDFGRRLNLTAKFFKEYIQPRQKNILRDFLKLGVIPKLPNIYRKDLLEVDIQALKGEDNKYKSLLEEAADYWNCPELSNIPVEQFQIDGVFITHGHYDHFQDISLLDPEIPIFCSSKTEALIKAIAELTQMKIENQFYYYYNYKLLKKGVNYKTVFPGSLEIKDEGRTDLDKFLLDIPEFELELTMKGFPLIRTFENIDEENGKELNSLQIDAISVDHSVPGAISFLVTDKKKQKTLLYSGDFRFEGIDTQDLKDFIQTIQDKKREIDVFICEGTRIDTIEMKTEKEIEDNITKKMESVKRLILIDFNWKDLGRFQTVLNACKKVGRTLLISPKTAYILFKFHQMDPNNYIKPIEEKNLGVYLKRRGALLYSPADYKTHELGYFKYWGKNEAQIDKAIVRVRHLLDMIEAKTDKSKEKSIETLFNKFKKYEKKLNEIREEWFGDADDDEVKDKLTSIWNLATFHFQNGLTAIDVRNSPEKYVLMFSFWDVNELFDLCPKDGDMGDSYFIRASTEPFNDEMVIDEQKMMEWLDYFKIQYDSEPIKATALVDESKKMFSREHVSGHAIRPVIKEIIAQLKPKKVVPIHTHNSEEFKKIGAELGIEIVIPKYGEKIEI